MSADAGTATATDPATESAMADIERRLNVTLGPMSWRTRSIVALLLAMVGAGVAAWIYQLQHGLAVTGMDRPAYWGLYMANFVFFIGISHAGTLISAVLRVVQAEWRRPITRCAEVITVFALLFGGFSVVLDLGRPDRVWYVVAHGRLQSPIVWDVSCITVYLTGSLLYLYLPLIPDLAYLRDRGARWAWLYRFCAMGYQDSPRARAKLERGIGIMAICIIPIAVSVHTVVSYIFATTSQPGWQSTIFGPYFVVGAIFSGIAALMIVMAIIRRAAGLQHVLRDVHFNNLGLLLLAMTCIMIYFTFNVFLVEITGREPELIPLITEKMTGIYAWPFWVMIGGGFILPALILAFPRGRSVPGCVCASVLILAGMWLERYLIVAPTLLHPRLPWSAAVYHASWVEWVNTLACLAAFALGYFLFARVFPIVSIWEVREGMERGAAETAARIGRYQPNAATPAPADAPADAPGRV